MKLIPYYRQIVYPDICVTKYHDREAKFWLLSEKRKASSLPLKQSDFGLSQNIKIARFIFNLLHLWWQIMQVSAEMCYDLTRPISTVFQWEKPHRYEMDSCLMLSNCLLYVRIKKRPWSNNVYQEFHVVRCWWSNTSCKLVNCLVRSKLHATLPTLIFWKVRYSHYKNAEHTEYLKFGLNLCLWLAELPLLGFSTQISFFSSPLGCLGLIVTNSIENVFFLTMEIATAV